MSIEVRQRGSDQLELDQHHCSTLLETETPTIVCVSNKVGR